MSKITGKPKKKKANSKALFYKIVSKNCPFLHKIATLVKNCEDCGGWNDEQLHDLFGTSVNEVLNFYDKYTRGWDNEMLIPMGMYDFFVSVNDRTVLAYNKDHIATSVCNETNKKGRWFNTEPVLKYFYISRNSNGTYTYKFKESQSIARSSDVPELSAKHGTGSLHNQQVLVRNP
jgi:hypothetical protein